MHRYQIWWQGQLAPDQLFLHRSPSSEPPLEPLDREQVTRHCQRLRDQGRRVENLQLYRFIDWKLDVSGLHLEVGQTHYEDYLGLSELSHPQAPLVLAVAAATEVEGRLVLERRSAKVAQGFGLLHVKPSGHVHPPSTPWQALLQEAWEELALQPEEVEQAQLIGLVRSLTANCISLIYQLRTTVCWSDWQSRTPVDAWESDELLGLPTDQASLLAWLAQPPEMSTGPGRAAVALYCQQRYG